MGQWSHSDLSQIANAPPCGSGPGDIPRPMGCVRSDGVNTVVFTGREDHHIHQLHLSGNTWVHTDLSLLANATDPSMTAATSPTSCVRPDNVFSVVYTGSNGHIHALQLTGGVASHVDLSALAGAPTSNRVGQPDAFRSRGWSCSRRLCWSYRHWIRRRSGPLPRGPIGIDRGQLGPFKSLRAYTIVKLKQCLEDRGLREAQ